MAPLRVYDPSMPAARNLSAAKEGDPGHRGRKRLDKGLATGREKPTEPDWGVVFGGDTIAAAQLRASARAEWRAVAGKLDAMGLLAGSIDHRAVMDYAICCARLDQCEQLLTEQGLTIVGRDQTMVRNPNATTALQYRTQLNRLLTHLGLSPHARAGLVQPEAKQGDVSDPFSAAG
jgi:P27 family predicted phage terminase small subunit